LNFSEKIKSFKSSGKGLMTLNQYLAIGSLLDSLAPCNFLVFGLGEDSYLWEDINKDGKCVFLEDDKDWIKKFKDSNLDIRKVNYTTRVQDFELLVENTEALSLSLPEDIRQTEWDIILVDAPLGHGPMNTFLSNTKGRPFKGPGRMSSIYEASRLVKKQGIVIVDDLWRLAESTYAIKYLGDRPINLVENKVGFFRR
tara:strand:+ start:51 stop:644 length:594 start_codon:yes stop_codon:yes gene_type:complete